MHGEAGFSGDAVVKVTGAALNVDFGLRGELRDTFACLTGEIHVLLLRQHANRHLPRGFTCSVTGLEAIVVGGRIGNGQCYNPLLVPESCM